MKIQLRNKSKGFTLLEIVVAVGIFAVIVSIVFPALIQFLDMRERVIEKHSEIVGLQKSFQFLANDLRFAANRLSKDVYGETVKTTLSLNDENLLDLTALYPDLLLTGLSVPRRVLWRVEEGKLLRIQYPVMDPDSETRTIKQVLLDGVEEVDIEVSFVEDGRSTSESRWEEQSRLPDIITVTVRLENDAIYTRVLDMQGGDSAAALLAAGSAPPQLDAGDTFTDEFGNTFESSGDREGGSGVPSQ